MNRHRILAIVAVTAAISACQHVAPNQAPASDLGCHQTIAAVDGMRSNLTVPDYFQQENPTKRGGEFDPNRYFEAFTHLKMKDGFTLDYVYHQDGDRGFPLLYARPVNQAPYANQTEYAAPLDDQGYLDFVIPQDSPEGYFEYAAFAMLADQFYLYWHAALNDWQVLCGMDDVEKVIKSLEGEDTFGTPMTDEQKREAREIQDPQPSVELSEKTATVKMLVFTKWGGFYRHVVKIRRADHSILKKQDDPLVEYQCGVMF